MYIFAKQIKNCTYYYAAINQRVNGQSRRVWQKYLGKAEDIVQRRANAQAQPYEAVIFEFGAVAALWLVAQRLQLVQIIDAFLPKRRQGPSVGQYLLIAALNRALCPTSKSKIGDWFDKTILRRLMPGISSPQLSSQHFWNHMDRMDEHHIRVVERELTETMIREFGLDLRAVVYDTTNFLTYLDSYTDADLPQRGKSKEKRNDLRIVGLALLVTLDCHVPLFHQVYPGNDHDSKTFASVTDELVLRYRALADVCEHVTLILDKGNNSASNQAQIDESPYYFVGSLVPSQHPDLLSVPMEEFRPLSADLAGCYAFRTRKDVLGAVRTVVVVFSDALYYGQLQGHSTKSKKAASALGDLCRQLERRRQGLTSRGKPPTVASVRKKVEDILSAQHLKEIVSWEVDEEDGVPVLRYEFDRQNENESVYRRFGKTILVTNNDDWPDEDIIRAYRGQYSVEHAFASMKDPHFVAWSPMYHWTDSKIRVHGFYCVLALMLSSLLRREVQMKADRGQIELADRSTESILQILSEIREVVNIYAPETKVKPQIAITRMTEMQRRLFDLLGLEAVASTQNYVE